MLFIAPLLLSSKYSYIVFVISTKSKNLLWTFSSDWWTGTIFFVCYPKPVQCSLTNSLWIEKCYFLIKSNKATILKRSLNNIRFSEHLDVLIFFINDDLSLLRLSVEKDISKRTFSIFQYNYMFFQKLSSFTAATAYSICIVSGCTSHSGLLTSLDSWQSAVWSY